MAAPPSHESSPSADRPPPTASDHPPHGDPAGVAPPHIADVFPGSPDRVMLGGKELVPVIQRAPKDPQDGPPRKPSVQFLPPDEAGVPAPRPASVRRRRMSSPPPPPLFEPRVSFDTFERVGELTSFSLIKKHKDYVYTKRSRTFLCGLDSNDYSEYALGWLIDELVDDGDEVVCLRVIEKDSDLATPVSVKQRQYREEAENLMAKIQEKNAENKAINLILEFAVGKVQDVIGDMIKLYEPAILIVGTRGRSLGGIQGLLPGSISKYCLQHSPVPVIVVRPNTKRTKNKLKRLHDPSRQSYRDLLYKAGEYSHDGMSREPSLAPFSSGDVSPPSTGPDIISPAAVDPVPVAPVAPVAPATPLTVMKDAPKGSPLVTVESVDSGLTDPASNTTSTSGGDALVDGDRGSESSPFHGDRQRDALPDHVHPKTAWHPPPTILVEEVKGKGARPWE